MFINMRARKNQKLLRVVHLERIPNSLRMPARNTSSHLERGEGLRLSGAATTGSP